MRRSRCSGSGEKGRRAGRPGTRPAARPAAALVDRGPDAAARRVESRRPGERGVEEVERRRRRIAIAVAGSKEQATERLVVAGSAPMSVRLLRDASDGRRRCAELRRHRMRRPAAADRGEGLEGETERRQAHEKPTEPFRQSLRVSFSRRHGAEPPHLDLSPPIESTPIDSGKIRIDPPLSLTYRAATTKIGSLYLPSNRVAIDRQRPPLIYRKVFVRSMRLRPRRPGPAASCSVTTTDRLCSRYRFSARERIQIDREIRRRSSRKFSP